MPQEHCPGQVSHETIDIAIYAQPRGALKKDMIAALRHSKPTRGRRRTSAAARSFVPEALRIQNRQERIESRLVPGHWEGDFIKGACNRCAVGVLVERKTRFVARLQDGWLHGRRRRGGLCSADEEAASLAARAPDL